MFSFTLASRVVGLTAIFLGLFAAQSVHAAPLTISMQANGSGSIFGSNATPYGGMGLLDFGYVVVRNNQSANESDDNQSVMRFDMTSLSALQTPGTTVVVNSAQLNLDFRGQAGRPTETTARIALGTNDVWVVGSPASLLWNQSSEELGSLGFTPTTTVGVKSFSLTGLDFLDVGSDNLLTLLLHADQNLSADFNELVFSTGPDSVFAGAAPQLVLDVSVVQDNQVPEPASVLLTSIAVMGLAVACRQRRAR